MYNIFWHFMDRLQNIFVIFHCLSSYAKGSSGKFSFSNIIPQIQGLQYFNNWLMWKCFTMILNVSKKQCELWLTNFLVYTWVIMALVGLTFLCGRDCWCENIVDFDKILFLFSQWFCSTILIWSIVINCLSVGLIYSPHMYW